MIDMYWERISEHFGINHAIGALLLGAVGWFFVRKKNKAEVKSMDISNVAAEQQIVIQNTKTFQMITNNLQDMLKMFKSEIRAIEEDNLVLTTEYRKKLRAARKEISNLEEQIAQLKANLCCVKNCTDRKIINQ